MSTAVPLALIASPVALILYAYLGYPALLGWLTRRRARWLLPDATTEWPSITITLPVYNEERVIRERLENLLALDYPAARKHILVLSDCSTDATDSIVREFASRGVELCRLPVRGGKSAAENAAAAHLRGDIVINVDATTRIFPGSLKALVRAFADPAVGVASGRIVSEGAGAGESNAGESSYMGFEMQLRTLETRWHGIIGANGCFYAIRRQLYDGQFPPDLSRDFASALRAYEFGYRAVSVEEAACGVPRASSLLVEYRRKVRTMQRGLQTLWFKRALLNPFRDARVAFMLWSHKLARWLVYPALLFAVVGGALLAAEWPWTGVLLAAGITAALFGWYEARRASEASRPRVLRLLAYATAANAAGVVAWGRTLRGAKQGIWEPTRRA